MKIDQHAPYDLEVFALTMRDMPDYWNPYGHTPPEITAYGLAAMRAAQIVEERKKPGHDNYPMPESEPGDDPA